MKKKPYRFSYEGFWYNFTQNTAKMCHKKCQGPAIFLPSCIFTQLYLVAQIGESLCLIKGQTVYFKLVPIAWAYGKGWPRTP
jgi:hypothetical protein